MSLEYQLQTLADQLTRPSLTTEERAVIESKIGQTRLALDYYMKAFELERQCEQRVE